MGVSSEILVGMTSSPDSIFWSVLKIIKEGRKLLSKTTYGKILECGLTIMAENGTMSTD
jgi:hypothetical protein